ncbi:MAG: tetratricopeptide repeat protein [Pirellulales bacterium]|nr:tetratricopeptide repeat protein [Pirellulales bacterium]
MIRLFLAMLLALTIAATPLWAQDAPATGTGAEKPTDPFQPKADTPADDGEDAAKKYPQVAEAHKLYAARDVKGALKLLEQASAKHKELPPAKVMLASIHFRANNAAGGKAALDEAVHEDPTNPEPYLVLADLAIREGRYTDAAMLVDKAVKNTASYRGDAEKMKKLKIRCYAAMVPISQRWKQWAQARADLDKWLALDPDNAVALYRMGEVLFHEGKRREAYEKLQAAKNSKNGKAIPNPAVVMGRLFLAAGEEGEREKNMEQAKKWMNFAADQADEDTGIKLGVSNWHWLQGNVDDARKHADAALDADPHLVDAKYLRGLIALYDRDYDTAKRQFESLLLQRKNHLGGNVHFVLALLEQNTEASRQEAVNLAQRLYRAAPNNAAVVATLGWVYYRTGKHEQAERLIGSLNSRNLSPEAAYYVAKMQSDRGKTEEAKKLLEVLEKRTQPFIYTKAAATLMDRLKN